MPNYCNWTCTITGPKEQMDKIKEYTKEKFNEQWGIYINFISMFHPCPKELECFVSPAQQEFGEDKGMMDARLKRFKKLYGHTDWYNRQLANRWTKRDLIDLVVEREGINTVKLFYSTAWSPPTEAMVKLSQLHPELIIDMNWEEPGMWFSGEARITEGEIESIDEYDDAYYGSGQKCLDCDSVYDPEDGDMWDEEYPDLCVDCANNQREVVLVDKKNTLWQGEPTM